MSLTSTTTSEEEFRPTTQGELQRFVTENYGLKKRPLQPVGGRTALTYGYPAQEAGIQIHLAGLAQVLDYPARDMTITVEAGIKLEQLASVLLGEKQRLPIDFCQGSRATLGGAIACNSSGPRRFGHGSWRDYVIGVSGVDAQGRPFKAGGRVVKNVAGYDLCKLMVGSLGTLGILTQVTLKLRPIPEKSAWIWAFFPALSAVETALSGLNLSQTRPVAVEVMNSLAAKEIASEIRQEVSSRHCWLGVAVEGSERDVRWQLDQLQRELSEAHPLGIVRLEGDQDSLWRALTEFSVDSESPLTFEATLLPSRVVGFLDLASQHGIAVQAHAGSGAVIGHFPDDVVTVEHAAKVLGTLRDFLRQSRGQLRLMQCSNDWKRQLRVFGESSAEWNLMRTLKRELDPDDLLNRGKLFGERV